MLHQQIAIKTATRIAVLRIQLAHCLAEAGWRTKMPIGEWVDLAVDDDTRLVRSFESFAVDEEGLWCAHFELRIDWDAYGRLKVTAETTSVGEEWPSGINPGLETVVQAFNKVRRERNLSVRQFISYRDEVNRDPRLREDANTLLGFQPARSPDSAGDVIDVVDTSVDGLNELGYRLRFAE